MALKTVNPYKVVKSIIYTYPNGDMKYIKFKTPLTIRDSGWEAVEEEISKRKESETDTSEDNISRSLRRAKNKISHYCHSNDFDMFLTLTIDSKQFKDRNDITKSMNELSRWLHLQRIKYGKFDYIFVPELHKNGGVHFHGVLKNYKGPLTKTKTRKGRSVYHVDEWKIGFTDLEKIQDIGKVSNYIRKYIVKDMGYIFGKKKYLVSKGLQVPEVTYNVGDLDTTEMEGLYENTFCESGYIKNNK